MEYPYTDKPITHIRMAIICSPTNLSQWGSSSTAPKGRHRQTDPQPIPGSTWASPPEPAWWGKESRRRLWIIQHILYANHYIPFMYSKSTVCPLSKGGLLHRSSRATCCLWQSNVGRGNSEKYFKLPPSEAGIKGRGNYENLYAVYLWRHMLHYQFIF